MWIETQAVPGIGDAQRLALAEIGSALVERPLSMPKYWSRVRAVAQWPPEALAAAGLRFTREGAALAG